jgi:predicted RNA binding protein YcfA (HicA-like mRNA interferase family)
MKLPRDIDADFLIKALKKLGYAVVRQSGSHIRIKTIQAGEHHETIPYHRPLKSGTLNSILKNIALHHGMTRDALIELLDK